MNLNESDLRTLLDTSNAPVVAFFGAKWCGPCRAFTPVFEKVAKTPANHPAPTGHPSKEGNQVEYVKMDVDECTQLCEDLNISIVPTIIIFKDSRVFARREGGFPTESHFTDWLNSQGIKSK